MLQNTPLLLFHDGTLRRVILVLLYFSGYQPAVSKISGLIGQNLKHQCRDCLISGVYSGHYYFPAKYVDPTSWTLISKYNPRRFSARSSEASKRSISYI